MFRVPQKWSNTQIFREAIHYAVGHSALGYFSGKATSKLLNANVKIPLLFLVSTLLDIDLLIPGLEHRGPRHSIIILTLLLIPAFAKYGKQATPNCIALAQHAIIGDTITGRQGTQLLWPIYANWYDLGVYSYYTNKLSNARAQSGSSFSLR